MPDAARFPHSIDVRFRAPITSDRNSGWACVEMAGSREIFGTGTAVKVAGTVDGHAFEASALPIGGGAHMIPIKAAIRKAIAKDVGDEVAVHLQQRLR
jgi:hypothetical protein